MPERKAVIEHVPVVRHHADESAHNRTIIVFDTDTGRRIGHSPHCTVKQVSYEKVGGTVTTTLEITPIKDEDQPCS